ncbi:hypothetical protein [Gelria sp. Kuro-4]|uniref:hypothetical protein n=1 Tax=Gelria sp. Kuro-4 TaxID=2796927 RepID=UPI001BEF0263|nr:hypothetical protein [Gelria sp. Kuro-4]BCV23274.1 hypothetical protein kuro4_00470 [Gelria sp. Kuro-4]
MEDKVFDYADAIIDQVRELFLPEEEQKEGTSQHLDLKTFDATKFLTAFVAAFAYFYRSFSQKDCDLLEATYIANRLVVQHLIGEAKKGTLVLEEVVEDAK